MKSSKSLAAFASDLGGGYQLYYFVKHNPFLKNYKKFFFLKGDSTSLIKKNENNNNLDDLNYDLIICSTSGNDYEKKIIELANKKNKQIWVIFDNWTNYKARLSYKGKTLLTSKIIVTDKYAYELAKINYKNRSIEISENYFLKYLKKRKMKIKKTTKKRVVFFSSPESYYYENKGSPKYRISWEKKEKNNIQNEINYIQNSDFLKRNINHSFLIRLHPLQSFLRNDKNFIYKKFIEREKSLETSISSADISIGKDSYIMFITDSLKIPTFSIVKDLYKREFRVPYPINNLE